MSSSASSSPSCPKLRGPILTITHGAGPLPLEGQQNSLVKTWSQLAQSVIHPSRPDAIVVISAHYHSKTPKVMVPNPEQAHAGVPNLNLFTLKFDYAGFPSHCYKYQFAPRGHAAIARAILDEMKKDPLLADAELDTSGVLDSGVWVPAMKMLPLKHQQPASLIASNHLQQQHQQQFINIGGGRSSSSSCSSRQGSVSMSRHPQQQHFSVNSFVSTSTSATTTGMVPIQTSTGVLTYTKPRSASTASRVSTVDASFAPQHHRAPSAPRSQHTTLSGFTPSSFAGTSATTSSSSRHQVQEQQQIVNYCDIPLVPVSVSADCDPAVQLAIGEAIRRALLKPLASNNNNNNIKSVVGVLGDKSVNLASNTNNTNHNNSSNVTSCGVDDADCSEKSKRTSSVSKRSASPSFLLSQQQQQQQNIKLPNVAIIGSGSIYHNFRKGSVASVTATTSSSSSEKNNHNGDGSGNCCFNKNLKKILSDATLSADERKEMMMHWRRIPGSSAYQPLPTKTTVTSVNRNEITTKMNHKNGTADHFMPLLSVVAASGYQPISETLTYDYFGAPCSDFIWR